MSVLRVRDNIMAKVALLLLFIAASLLVSESFATECCPALWTQFNNTCYRYIGKPQTWSDAESKCQELAESLDNEGHLVSIHSPEENEFIYELWTSSLTPAVNSIDTEATNALWLGLTGGNPDGLFIWSDASDNEGFTHWIGESSPNYTATGEDNCCRMWDLGDFDSRWSNARCDLELPFVCKLGPELVSIAEVDDSVQHSHVCEHETLHIQCAPDQGLSILSAHFGRLDRSICSDNPHNTDTDSCTSESSLDIVRANCETYSSCDVAATYNVFGNPCGDVFKYLEVSYECVDQEERKSYVCEHSTLHLECGAGQVLSIKSANYGRLNRDICSNHEWKKNTDTCRTYNTLSIVQANCDNQRSCDVSATNTMFGDPCGSVFKYLDVTYMCIERTTFRATSCEHETLHLECQSGRSIFIKAANYGRLHRNICSNNQFNKNNDSCRSDNSVSIVSKACENYHSCEIPATSENFGNPCDDIYKYLEVIYTCEEVDNTQLQSGYVCEDVTLHLECGVEEGISILSANYGRLNGVICSDNPWNTDTDSCYSDSALNIVRANCDTHHACDISATNTVFGNPCGDIFKYLEVTYICKERPTTSVYACENDNAHLECNAGEVIFIKLANYGRLNRNVCSNNNWAKDTDSCRTFNTDYIVKANCDNRRSCDVPASNTMFGDPCGNIFKYLQVTYSCQETTAMRDYVCENETLHLECDEGHYVKIQSANYGRLHRNVCSNNEWNKNTDSCRSTTSLSNVREACDGHLSCDVPATSSFFGGDPCEDIYKYLEVLYTCQVDNEATSIPV